MVSEADEFVDVCADLVGYLQRPVNAEILIHPFTAEGKFYSITA